jgi:hypothetical protein
MGKPLSDRTAPAAGADPEKSHASIMRRLAPGKGTIAGERLLGTTERSVAVLHGGC